MFILKQRKKYQAYYKKKKIRRICEIDNLVSGEIEIREKHYIMSNGWWLFFMVFDVVAGFIGSIYEDVEEKKLKSFSIKYEGIDPETFEVDITPTEIIITGVKKYKIVDFKETVPELMTKRIKARKKIILGIVFSFLVLVAAGLAIIFIVKGYSM